MKIQVKEAEKSFCLNLPTSLIFSRFVLRLALKHSSINGRKIDGLTAEAADALSAEIRRIKKRHGTWELVEVRSADGETVKITL